MFPKLTLTFLIILVFAEMYKQDNLLNHASFWSTVFDKGLNLAIYMKCESKKDLLSTGHMLQLITQ